MCQNWIDSIDFGSFNVTEIRRIINRLPPEALAILNQLIRQIINECPEYTICACRGWGRIGLHISLSNAPKPFVMAAIIPQIRRGIRVNARNSLAGFRRGTNPQLPWHGIIGRQDIDAVIRYLAGQI